MKAITIMFDRRSNLWSRDQGFNSMTLMRMEQIINDIIGRKGYVYLNQIYEWLGLEWDPTHENPCFTKANGCELRHIEFEVFNKSDGSVLIVIHRY